MTQTFTWDVHWVAEGRTQHRCGITLDTTLKTAEDARRYLWDILKDEQHPERKDLLELFERMNDPYLPQKLCAHGGKHPIADVVVRAAAWWNTELDRRNQAAQEQWEAEGPMRVAAYQQQKVEARANGVCPTCLGAKSSYFPSSGRTHACGHCRGTGKYTR